MNPTTFTSTAHEFVDGQTIAITETDNYDGTYDINVTSADVFIIQTEYYDNETGTAYPILDGDYYISFLIPVEDIFNEIKLRTALKARGVKDQNGFIVPEIPLTEDRRDLFLILLEKAGSEVFRLIQAYGKGIVNAYRFNTTIDLDGDGTAETTARYMQFTINENKTYQDENIYPLIESKMKEAMVAYILKEWYQLASLGQDMRLSEMQYNDISNMIRSLAMKAEGKKPISFNEGFR